MELVSETSPVLLGIALAVGLVLFIALVRRNPALHMRIFVVGARLGKPYLLAMGLTVAASSLAWNLLDTWQDAPIRMTAMWIYAMSSVGLLSIGYLRILRHGNVALVWSTSSEACLHLTSKTLTAETMRSFVDTAGEIWLQASRMGFKRLRLLSPLLGSELRCERLAQLLVERARLEGVCCEVQYIQPRPWNWFESFCYFIRYDRKTRSRRKLEQRFFERVFRVRVGGFTIVASHQF